MKIKISHKGKNHLASLDSFTSYKDLQAFVYDKYPKLGPFHFVYQDQDKEMIVVSSDYDLVSVKEFKVKKLIVTQDTGLQIVDVSRVQHINSQMSNSDQALKGAEIVSFEVEKKVQENSEIVERILNLQRAIATQIIQNTQQASLTEPIPTLENASATEKVQIQDKGNVTQNIEVRENPSQERPCKRNKEHWHGRRWHQRTSEEREQWHKKKHQKIDRMVEQKILKMLPEISRIVAQNLLRGEPLKEPVIDPNSEKIVHFGITCDGCGVRNFEGVRFKCYTCKDFDFCQKCEANNKDHQHPFIKIKNPQNFKKNNDVSISFDGQDVNVIGEILLDHPFVKNLKDCFMTRCKKDKTQEKQHKKQKKDEKKDKKDEKKDDKKTKQKKISQEQQISRQMQRVTLVFKEIQAELGVKPKSNIQNFLFRSKEEIVDQILKGLD